MAETNPTDEAAEKLYIAVAKASRDEDSQAYTAFFAQDELARIGGLKNIAELIPLISRLTSESLFRVTRANNKLGWSVRPREAAKQIKSLDRDERMIYETVEEAYTDGVWTKSVKTRTKIAPNVINRALDRLQTVNLIKSVRSIKNPHQKVFILSHLVASESVTGNSFYDAGQLDEDFRDQLLNLIVFYVRQNSWAEAKRRKVKQEPGSFALTITDSIEIVEPASSTKKRKRDTTTADIEEAGQPPRTKQRGVTRHKGEPEMETEIVQLAFRAGTHTYPTATSIHDFLISSEVIKGAKAKTLTTDEIQACLDILQWDDKLERVWNAATAEHGYRSVRGVRHLDPTVMYDEATGAGMGTGYTETPCSKCPVFDICKDGAAVNPTDCGYYTEWLKQKA